MINANPQGGGGQQGRRVRSGLPYLKNENLTFDKQRAHVLACRVPREDEANTYGNAVILKITIGGREYLWGLKATNPVFRVLIEAFGADENKWAGRDLFVYLEEDEFTKAAYARVEIIKETKKA